MTTAVSPTQVRSMELFSLRDHPNTLAPLDDDNFLVVLHNLGQVNHCLWAPAECSAAFCKKGGNPQRRGRWLFKKGRVKPHAMALPAWLLAERRCPRQRLCDS